MKQDSFTFVPDQERRSPAVRPVDPGEPRGGPAAQLQPLLADSLSRAEDLAGLRAHAAGCRRCQLRSGCNQVVFGEGNPQAQVLLVGEAPGAEEDRTGRPFVGRAGQLLNRILASVGFQRDEVYITNVTMCRPPANRAPSLAEMNTCLPHLEAKIRVINPRVLVCLGSTAAQALIHPTARITRLRGLWRERQGMLLMPTYHPAALLRDETKKRPVWEDFKAIRLEIEGKSR